MKLISPALLICLLIISACSSEEKPAEEPSKPTGVNVTDMNIEVIPCHDFFEYASGSWIKNNPVPSTESRWSNFNLLEENNNALLKRILETAAEDKNAAVGSNTQKLGDYYSSAIDSIKRDEDGIKPLQEELDRIAQLENNDHLIDLLAHHHSYGISSLFSVGIGQDAKRSDQYAVYMGQSGIGLPDRDYYLLEDEKSKELRKQYMDYIQTMFMLMGEDEATAETYSESIMQIETKLATMSMNAVERRDIDAQYNKMSWSELTQRTPNLDWERYFTKGIGQTVDSVIVSQPKFFDQVNTMMKDIEPETWKVYLRWSLIRSTASLLSSDFVQANFDFYGTILQGQKEMKPSWKRALRSTNRAMGELLGQEFVKEAFTESTKAKVDAMVKNLILSLKERLDNLEWMGEETKKQAHKKIASLRTKIGYPDKWKDYSSLEVGKDSYAMNNLRARNFAYRENINKLGKPVDLDEWAFPPQTVNAYYNPLNNEIVFPAGILQPPFYDPNADDALNYGGIGAVIGHELTHGFDDQGNRFDAHGNLNNWWTEDDYTNFRARAAKVIAQFDRYKVLDSIPVKGALTVGENIADLGGLTIAFNAYQKSLEGKQRDTIDGFSPEQRFFISWGQVWKANYTEAALRQQVMTNPHSPPRFRVIGPLSNIPEFYEAFGCSDQMPDKDSLIVIW